jgi:putative ABC transport system permease protein
VNVSDDDRVERARQHYRWLLRLYPRTFRVRFGDDLMELFTDLYRRQALASRRLARARFWLRMINDAIRRGCEEHAQARRGAHRLPLGAHRAKGTGPMTSIAKDLRDAFRALRRQPAITAVIISTLALAIGANSAIFSVVNGVLLRPLPFDKPERVVMLYEVDPRGRDNMVSVPTFEDWQRGLKTITGISVMGGQTANLTGVAEPDRLRAGFVTFEFFNMLGVQPIIGRAFQSGEDGPGSTKTAVLAYAIWQRRFGGDPAILGRSLVLNNEPHQ